MPHCINTTNRDLILMHIIRTVLTKDTCHAQFDLNRRVPRMQRR